MATPSPIANIRRASAIDEIRELNLFDRIEWLDTIDSTNKYLSRSLKEGAIHAPALVVADRQSMGVGRGSHQWWSPDGCLMFSFALPLAIRDPSDSADAALLPLRVGCAMAESVEQIIAPKPLLKWPNDIYIDDKKVCGVLIEAIPVSKQNANSVAEYVTVVGMGINCQVNFDDAPESIRSIATSLHLNSRHQSSEVTAKENVLVRFFQKWLELLSRDEESPGWLTDAWQSRNFLDQKWVEVKHANGLCRGRCIGVSSNGALRIIDEQSVVHEMLSGTVQSYSATQ